MLDRRHFLTATTGMAATPAFRSPLLAQHEKAAANLLALWGLRASIKLTNDIGLDRIEPRHRTLADYVLAEMIKRGAEFWTSPDPTLRCAIVIVKVPPIVRMDLENWMWKTHKIRIRGGDTNKLRISTPYYLQKKDIDRFLERLDEYKHEKKLP